MKKNMFFKMAVVAMSQWMVSYHTEAQSEWLSPHEWDSLVQNQQKNPVIRDTVLYQSFDSDNPLSVNYRVSGKYDFFYPKEAGIQGSSDSRAIRLYPGSTLTFDTIVYPALEKAMIYVPFAIQHINEGEDMYFTTYFHSKNYENFCPYKISADDCSLHFREKASDNKRCIYYGTYYEPYRLQIEVRPGGTGSGGFYCIDSLFLTGDIEKHSLLRRPGAWHDHALWSHDYPSPRRVALIDADVHISQAAECLHLINHEKNIRIQPEGSLHARQATSFRTFAEKGKWYFVSFPHDVPLGGIDPKFRVGDASTVTEGSVNNILYIQAYDGKRRAERNLPEGNWSVLSADGLSPDDLILEKGKGYLMAIDETAELRTLSFSSPEDSPVTYREEMSVRLEADALQGDDEAHNGWILCGNPYPSDVSLQEIMPDPALDGHVYLYDGHGYEAYPIGGDHAIPAGCAFFVKADRDTELRFRKKEGTGPAALLTRATLPCQGTEPGNPPAAHAARPTRDVLYAIRDGKIRVTAARPGELILYDALGKKVQHVKWTKGGGEYALPRRPGFYFLLIASGQQRECVKIKR